MLADEPTGNLDSKNSVIVLDMLRHSNRELGQTVLMITHNPEAASYGDRIIHMRDGEIVSPEKDPQWTGATEYIHHASRFAHHLETSSMDDLKKPILPGKGASDYERYLRTDELLSLQKLPEEFLHKDEMTFQVVHQAFGGAAEGGCVGTGTGAHAYRRRRFRERGAADSPRQPHARLSDLDAARAGNDHAL